MSVQKRLLRGLVKDPRETWHKHRTDKARHKAHRDPPLPALHVVQERYGTDLVQEARAKDHAGYTAPHPAT